MLAISVLLQHEPLPQGRQKASAGFPRLSLLPNVYDNFFTFLLAGMLVRYTLMLYSQQKYGVGKNSFAEEHSYQQNSAKATI